MISKESDSRFIGYGAMVVESIVSVIALIAACSLYPGDYFAINVPPEVYANLHMHTQNLAALSQQVGENVVGRTGGAVSLAVGFAQIFSGLPGMQKLMSYWYHFAIMFEALFILTTIDAGTRVARFLVQEFGGRVYKPLARTDWLPGTLLATSVVVFGWGYFIWTGNISTIWPMFGTANQLLAGVALAIVTACIINSGKARYVWVSLVPLAFVGVTTLYAGWRNIFDNFRPLLSQAGQRSVGVVNITMTGIIMVCLVIIVIETVRRCYKVLVRGQYTVQGKPVLASAPDFKPPDYGEA